ncbi:MAG: RnfABCDGE type electron transport complex subunit D [Spirochaetia bacterium]|nr:RnfABCDGE type electron transport complex subunit D [Spirochaetia bacterium]
MNSKFLQLDLRSSPHVKRPVTVEVIMRNVVYALIPVSVFAVYAFGISALAVILTTTVFSILTEYIMVKVDGREITINDYSAAITGILLGLTLPPGFPLWMAALGGIISIALGKYLFGGLGFNIYNPALVGRGFLQAAFPVSITTWHPAFNENRFSEFFSSNLAAPFLKPTVEAVSGATPLAALKFEQKATDAFSLMFGKTDGSLGETGGIIILLCGIYLAVRKMLDWRIPVSIFAVVIIFSTIFNMINPEKFPSALFMLFSGGLMLGAVFMATDMVTSPVTKRGTYIYGILIGLLIVIIRIWGGLPEGVMFAILFSNGLVPVINILTKSRVYGTKK